MTDSVFIKKGNLDLETDTHAGKMVWRSTGRVLYEDKRLERPICNLQNAKDCQNTTGSQAESRKDSSATFRGNMAADTWISGFCRPELRDNSFPFLLASQFVALCHCNCDRQIQLSSDSPWSC